MTDNQWGGILNSRNSKEIAEEFRKSLAAKMAGVESEEALNLLRGIREELLKEISAGRRIPEEIEALIGKLPAMRIVDELQVSRENFLQLAAELYRTRSSVSSTFSLARSFYDSLISSAFIHAWTQLKNERGDSAELTYSLLVSGELGRAESILGSRSRFFFIYQESAETDNKYVNELAMRFMAVLSICLPDISRNLTSPTAYWFGSDTQWRKTATGLFQAGEPDKWDKSGGNSFTLFVETVADMRMISGDSDFGLSIIATGRKMLADSLQSYNFWHLAKDIATMPVAIGVFGRFKTVRSGNNRGKIDLKRMAIDPLANSVRILALACGNDETTFSGRIKAILAAGNLGVALADGLLIAYQDFMRARIRLELTGSNGADGLFLDPEELDEESKERFRTGLDNITTLQRLVHQQLVEVQPG